MILNGDTSIALPSPVAKAAMDIYELMGLKDGVKEDRGCAIEKCTREALAHYFARSLWDARRIFSVRLRSMLPAIRPRSS